MGIAFIAADKAFVAHLPESCSICQLPCHDRILAWLASHDICSSPVPNQKLCRGCERDLLLGVLQWSQYESHLHFVAISVLSHSWAGPFFFVR